MAKHGKKYLEAAKLVEPDRVYDPAEAAALVKQTTTVNFDASIEVHLRLGVDPRHADQMVRGTVVLPHGINIIEFTKSYNEKTADKVGQVIPAQITIYEDRSFTFVLKTPPAADLLRKAAGVENGAQTTKRETVGRVTRDQVRQIAETKLSDLNANDIDAAMRQIEGTARSMGIDVIG